MPKIAAILRSNLHILVFFIMLILSFFIYKDFGISWDEPEQREIGCKNYKYIENKDFDLQNFRSRSYGVLIEVPLIFIERQLKLTQPDDIFKMRHLLTHLLFLIGVFIFYYLNYFLFGQRALAFISMLLLYLSPPIFGHSFFNTKDIPLMVFMIFGIYAMLRFVDKPSYKRLILLSVVVGLTLGVRITGLLLFFLVCVFFLFLYFNKKTDFNRLVKYFSVFLITTFIVYYIICPAMWVNPPGYIWDTFFRMANYPWKYNNLYLGNMIPATKLPWHYVPVWILLTLPILHLFFISTGFFYLYYFVIKKPKKVLSSFRLFFIALAADIPLLVVILLFVMGSTLYDSWRHVFFIYPFLLIIGVFGLKRFIEFTSAYKYLKAFPLLITYMFLFFIALKMYSLHPYEYLYFNNIISHSEENIRNTMEMDYWGISYKEALETIVDNDNRPIIKVKTDNYSGEQNLLIIPGNQRKRIQVTNNDDWDYFITNYRMHPQDYSLDADVFTKITRLNSSINVTYRKKINPK